MFALKIKYANAAFAIDKQEEIVRRIRHYQFNSKACRERFGHLLSSREDY